MSPSRAIRSRPETLLVACLLAGVGGFLDAYTFWWRGVFANAQTGNVVLMAVNSALGQWHQMLVRLPAMAAFLMGVLCAQVLATSRARRLLRRPTRWVLAVEVLVLAVLGFMPWSIPTIALTVPVSFVAALQVSTFKLVTDVSYNTTMATGNLRSLVASAFTGIVDHDADELRHSATLAAVVLSFAFGAAGGTVATRAVHAHASWIAAAILLLVMGLLVLETHRVETPHAEPNRGDA